SIPLERIPAVLRCNRMDFDSREEQPCRQAAPAEPFHDGCLPFHLTDSVTGFLDGTRRANIGPHHNAISADTRLHVAGHDLRRAPCPVTLDILLHTKLNPLPISECHL